MAIFSSSWTGLLLLSTLALTLIDLAAGLECYNCLAGGGSGRSTSGGSNPNLARKYMGKSRAEKVQVLLCDAVGEETVQECDGKCAISTTHNTEGEDQQYGFCFPSYKLHSLDEEGCRTDKDGSITQKTCVCKGSRCNKPRDPDSSSSSSSSSFWMILVLGMAAPLF